MKIDVVGTEETGWELIHEGEEPIGVAEKMSYLSAVDAFAANWPEYMDELDVLRAEYVEFVGEPAVQKRQRVSGQPREKKRGSGARFRELILAGKSNEECLRTVRAEFPESKATLSDVAWNRGELRKNPGGYLGNGQRV